MTNLKIRIATISVILPLMVCFVLILNSFQLALFLLAWLLLGAHEWANLTAPKTPQKTLFWSALSITMVYTAYSLFHSTPPFVIFDLSILLYTLAAMALVFRAALFEQVLKYNGVAELIGVIVLTAGWGALVGLHQMPSGPQHVLCLCAFVWMNDTGAYIAGRYCGKTPLAPRISPKKTWEGFWGGLAMNVLVALAISFALSYPISILGWIFIGMLVGLYSVVGDLLESALKRAAGVKDSGTLLPGHGGVLDRIDSLISAAPIYWTALYMMSL